MVRTFAALRFTAAANLSDRTYWYLSPFPLREGMRVLAPVGAHDRLQCAAVERVLAAEERDAPYDMRCIKQTAAPLGARRIALPQGFLLELGGLAYDQKHYTRLGRIVVGEGDGGDYGVTTVCFCGRDDLKDVLVDLLRARGCAQLCGPCSRVLAAALLLAAGVRESDVRTDARRLGSAEEIAPLLALGAEEWLRRAGLGRAAYHDIAELLH